MYIKIQPLNVFIIVCYAANIFSTEPAQNLGFD